MVRLGDADVLLGAYRTDVPDFVFHERPAVFSRMLFWTHTDNDWEFDGIESLKGVKIGIIKGYSYGDSLDAYLAANPKQVQEGYGSDALGSLVKRLERRRVDVIIEDDWVISYYLKSNPEMQTLRMAGGVEGVPVFIPLSPANPERSGRLAQLIDAGIEALQESGEMSRIYEKYGVGVAHSVGTVGAKTGDD
jgi:polar amino acid transport system substrate-binding protein